jgi:hypothetical protein
MKFRKSWRSTAIRSSVSFSTSFHVRDGEVDRVHGYINGASWWINMLTPTGLSILDLRVRREIGRAQ